MHESQVAVIATGSIVHQARVCSNNVSGMAMNGEIGFVPSTHCLPTETLPGFFGYNGTQVHSITHKMT